MSLRKVSAFCMFYPGMHGFLYFNPPLTASMPSLVRSFLTISGLTAVSRGLGFIRDMLTAALLGAGPLTDAFFIAFKLPNFLRRLFAEGAFNAAFIPLYSGLLATDGEKEARNFARESYAALFWTLLVLTCVAELFMPFVVSLMAPGFKGDQAQFELTVGLARITFPYLLFIALSALLTGALNSHGRFGPGAAAPIMLNICMISVLLLPPEWFGDSAHALSWGVFAAGITQLGWLHFSARRHGLYPSIAWPRLNARIKRLLLLMGPAALGAGVVQINLFIDIILASTIPTAVSYLYYADRLYELPLSMIGIAIGTALLPVLSTHWKIGEAQKAIDTQNRALELAFAFALPSAVALVCIARPIIFVLFEHGEFTAVATAAVTPALMAFGIGLPALIATKVFLPAFYAQEDTKTPVKIALICIAVNLCFNLVLMQFLAHVGLALSTTIAGYVQAILMVVVLSKRGLVKPDAILKKRLVRLTLAAMLMGAVLEGLEWWLTQYSFVASAPKLMQVGGLGILVTVGMLSYGVMVLATRALSLDDVKRLSRRRRTESKVLPPEVSEE